MPDWLILLPGFLFGALIGSFLNVCIHRLPRNESVVMPPSRCYSCGTRVAWYDNLPVLSWLILRGRCRHCGATYGVRYMIGEVLVGCLTAAALWWSFKLVPELPATWLHGIGVEWLAVGAGAVAVLVVCYYLWVASLIDIDHEIIPDELSMAMQAVAPFLGCLLPLAIAHDWWPDSWWLQANERGIPMFDPWSGLIGTLWWAVPAIAILPLTLPLARWVYDNHTAADAAWEAKDHRGFAVGVWWFVVVSVVQLLVLVVVTLLAARPIPMPPASFPTLHLLHVQLSLAILGSLAGWWSLYGIGLLGTIAFRRNAMGFGDVKLLAPIGAMVGPWGVVVTFLMAAAVGTVIGLPRRLLKARKEIPFGPFLALGAVVAMVAGLPVTRFIAGFFAPT